MKIDQHPTAKRLIREARKERNIEAENYYTDLLQVHKEKLISDRKQELEQLKKRIRYLEQELDGMGVRDYEFMIYGR
ncbi:hypothetical protein UFOVP264_44 [uncultured Caudovirales phage]|uniref:Uncharacterized protein n=1 Tax=uncultured Caudovirales phage TaxID=2100421 RepID=A0A6J5LL72_9CAUD|nr:hypothetical protein UFOVP264_44 [uncultured Caudovirales phage]